VRDTAPTVTALTATVRVLSGSRLSALGSKEQDPPVRVLRGPGRPRGTRREQGSAHPCSRVRSLLRNAACDAMVAGSRTMFLGRGALWRSADVRGASRP